MDRPTAELSAQLVEQCPSCRASVPPVVTSQDLPTLLMAAYRCIMCRTDFTSIWQQGYVRQNQPSLPFGEPITSDVFTPIAQPFNSASAPDGVCQKCSAQPGTPHALACPYA